MSVSRFASIATAVAALVPASAAAVVVALTYQPLHAPSVPENDPSGPVVALDTHMVPTPMPGVWHEGVAPWVAPCLNEDASEPTQAYPCVWDASIEGNGVGLSFVVTREGHDVCFRYLDAAADKRYGVDCETR